MYNQEHHFEVWKKHPKKEEYCFPLRKFLGENGLYANHPLVGHSVVKKGDGQVFIIDNVYVHYFGGGFYYTAIAHNSHKSSTVLNWNINCPNLEISTNSYLFDMSDEVRQILAV